MVRSRTKEGNTSRKESIGGKGREKDNKVERELGGVGNAKNKTYVLEETNERRQEEMNKIMEGAFYFSSASKKTHNYHLRPPPPSPSSPSFDEIDPRYGVEKRLVPIGPTLFTTDS
ncbi:hypothetical protein Sjap_015508 [Stephania japonica]|uniref:Uncharacterized protein n=1 Tax=Stephania japonica TaxID=461633 RepID=A0AAP0NU13_9MAGN